MWLLYWFAHQKNFKPFVGVSSWSKASYCGCDLAARRQGPFCAGDEHNLDATRCADWIIDLGPEGCDKGGQSVVPVPPEEATEHPSSRTGRHLK